MIALEFEMSQSQANEWIHKLSRILRMSLDKLGQVPERDALLLIAALQNIADDEEIAIDGTERRCQRPKDSERQKEYYSGKKKAHTVKNNDVFRNTKAKFDDLVMEIGCALHNFRTDIRSYFQINFR